MCKGGASGRVVCVKGRYVWKGGICGRVGCVVGWCVSKGGVCVGGVYGRMV